MKNALLNFHGRMNRAPFWGWSLLVPVLTFVLLVVVFIGLGFTVDSAYPEAERLERITDRFNWAVVPAVILMFWPLAALNAKRLQDLGRPVWWTIPVMIPSLISIALFAVFGANGPQRGPFWWLDVALALIALGFTIWLGFVRGTRGDNPFGPDPLAGKGVRRAKEAGVGV